MEEKKTQQKERRKKQTNILPTRWRGYETESPVLMLPISVK
jgi:hypothetical protein